MPEIYSFRRNDILSSNCYAVVCGNDYCIIDPSVSLEHVKNELGLKKKPEFVLLTHEHLDHLWEINSYISQGIKILCSKECALNAADSEINCSGFICGKKIEYTFDYNAIKDGEIIYLGNKSIKAFSTKGHAKGSICYLIDDCCFTGDTLFAEGSYGRYDIPGADYRELMQSLVKLLYLDENITIYPGHGKNTTIKETKRYFKI